MLKYNPGIKAVKAVKDINYNNRGMDFENEINISNAYYLEINIALIYKKPTPIKIVKASRSNNTYKINEAYFMMPSTTDYNGLYKGHYIDFEAKETNFTTSFPLSNIHQNQISHLIKVLEHGGISFLLVRFNKLNITYLYLTKYLDMVLKENKKSISIDEFNRNGFIVNSLYVCPVDYLKIIDDYLLK